MKKILLSILLFASIGNATIQKLSTATTFYAVMVDSITLQLGKTGVTTPIIYRSNFVTSAQVTGFTWTEIDSTNMKGVYSVWLPATVFPAIGEYVFVITSSTCIDFRKNYDVVANVESDSYQSIASASNTIVNAVNVSSTNGTAFIILQTAVSSGAIKNEISKSTNGVTVAVNSDKTGYFSTLTEHVTAYRLINNDDKDSYSILTNLDKTGYSGTLTENVTAYTLINNQDKNGYTVTQGTVTVTNNKDKSGYTVDSATITKITGASLNDIWNYNIDGKDNNSSGFYVVKGTNTDSSSGTGATAQQVWEYTTRALTDKDGFTITQGTVTVNNNKDKSGYSVIDGTVTVQNNKDKTGYTTTGDSGGASAMDIWSMDISTFTTKTAGGYVVNGATRAVSATASITATDITAISTTVVTGVWSASTSTYNTDGTFGKKMSDLPLTGTGDWTANEKTWIKQSLSIFVSSSASNLQNIQRDIKIYR